MFGKLLGSAVRIVNTPIRATENLLGVEDEDDRLFSKPADALADELDDIDDDDDD
jgi:hypothetical protein